MHSQICNVSKSSFLAYYDRSFLRNANFAYKTRVITGSLKFGDSGLSEK